MRRYGDDNLVLVVLGDHQPATLVTGHDDPSHDVPISVIAHDPKVMRPDRRMELAGRHVAEPAGAGLAHGRVP